MHAIHRPTDRAYVPVIHRPTDRADTHTIYHRPTDCANMPTIPITVVLICLRPKHDQVELCSLENDPVAGTVLLPNQTMTATPTVQPTERSRRYACDPITN